MRSWIAAAAAATWLFALALSGGAYVGRDASGVAWFTAAIAMIGMAHLVATAFVPRVLKRLPSTPRTTGPAIHRVGGGRVF